MPVLPFCRNAPLLRTLLAVIVVGAYGCGAQTISHTPSPSVAEGAVRRALDAWKAGLPAGEVPNSKPAIHVTDAGRKPGQTLESYQILGETRGAAGRTFAVQLRLAYPEADVKTQYVVVGIEPLWVFRKEDYDLLMHWDHHMPAAETETNNPESPSEPKR